MIALHLVVQRQEVEGVTAHSTRLELRKEVLWGEFSVERLGIPELSDPCVGDNGEDELCRLLSHCLVRRAVFALRFMRRFYARGQQM